MTPAQKQAKERAEVMLAFANGKTIEARAKDTAFWWTLDDIEPYWDWRTTDYRIKPEPRVVYLLEHLDGLDPWTAYTNQEFAEQRAKGANAKVRKFAEVLE